jgi:hypothetical protein
LASIAAEVQQSYIAEISKQAFRHSSFTGWGVMRGALSSVYCLRAFFARIGEGRTAMSRLLLYYWRTNRGLEARLTI